MLLWFNKDKPDAEGSEKKKKDRDRDIDLQWDNTSQAEGPWQTYQTDRYFFKTNKHTGTGDSRYSDYSQKL